MTMLVTLQQASDHLRRDTTDDDDDLTLKIEAASGIVLAYITESAYVPDEAGAPTAQVLPEVQNATLVMVGYLYKDRDQDADEQWERGYPPRPVASLLQHLRTPGIA